MADPLAITKLHVPSRRAGMIARRALVEPLCVYDGSRLTLISAPAGAGKTTLLAEWHASALEQRPFAWLSLDRADSDPVRFWMLVIEALATVHPGFGSELRSVHLPEVIVALLINEAARLPPTVLVLDDLQLVDIDLTAFIERAPASLHVAIATRVDPPLPLSRLRVRGELRELRGSDLRLSAEETEALLDERFGVRLAPRQLERLHARTEGWAAAVQLAGLSLRRGADADALIAGEAEVLDYLAGEVLDAQDAATRAFLIETSVLERMTAPLCDAVTGGDDAASRLPELDRRNLLVVALDPGRRWWRYHHLFAEVLRARVAPERAVELHRRACEWHAAHGLPDDAIRHALATGDPGRAEPLVAEHWREVFNRGELATVERWLDALPGAQLWLARLWVLMDRGRLDEAGALLAAAPPEDAWGQLLHALHAFKIGDVGAAEDRVALASELDPEDRFWRTVAALVRGLAGYANGRVGAAQAFDEAAALARADGNQLGLAYALGYRVLIAVEQGGTNLGALDEVADAVGEHFVAFSAALARATAAEREGRYEAAAGQLVRAGVLARRGAGRTEIAQVTVALAQVQWARGRRAEALGLAREAREALRGAPDPGRAGELLVRLDARLGTRVRDLASLSESERAVLELLPTPLSNREIGERLYISINTVKSHLRSIYAKLGSSSREQAVGRARELGLL